ncbi:MAG: primosomal protein N' [Actinobacteria bacterium]|nr:primosomal protein N' [Actinomycetota bacterium]
MTRQPEVEMPPASDELRARVVQVVPLLKLRHLGDRSFDYLVPEELADRVQIGSLVRVPFGRRTALAVVESLGASGEVEEGGLRRLESVTGDYVPPELLALARTLSARFLASYESCLRLMAPPSTTRRGGPVGGSRNTWVERTDGETDAGGASDADDGPEPGCASGADGGRGSGAASDAGGPTVRLTAKQKALLEAIPVGGTAIAAVCEQVGVGPGVVRALAAKGLVEIRPRRPGEQAAGAGHGAQAAHDRGVGAQVAWGVTGPPLRVEQERAVEALIRAYAEPGFSQRLLWGVTGSGKTEVYLRVVAHVLAEGAGAILLVPEIALTPQMISRVRARFGNKVGVLHSGLAQGERVTEHRRIASGEAPVVVGARSAVFAPVRDLRLIVIDESHDSSYKQEEEPRYHARTAAALRLRESGGLLLEGSATPAVEDMERGGERIRLTYRAAGAPPECEVVDMRRQGAASLLAPRSREALAETLRRGEQAIVLLNRRGFAAHVHCDLCGHVMTCRDCELSLTYHSRERRLVCHHCGRAYAQPALCPECGEAPLTRTAPGTERLDRELRGLVPRGQVFRMDSDVLTSGSRVQAILEEFAVTRPAVLVGTQMVAKGHDFADVTLVLVADADTGLYLPDFRAAERTFQLLTQVAGRAGRAERPGRVLVQTWNPDVPCIRMALERDEELFYKEELSVRERLGYPPFTELIRVMTVAEHAERAQVASQYLVERLAAHFKGEEIKGPVRLPKLRGRARWHLLIAARDGARARRIVGQAMAQLSEPYRRRGVTLLVDVDPQSFG